MSEITNTFIFNPIRPDFIDRCLDTLYKYTSCDFRVILIDQTVDGIYDQVKDKVDLYLRSKRINLGFAKSSNEGMIHALHWKSKFVTPCNDDIEFINKNWWEGAVKTFEYYPTAGLVNPYSVIDRNEAEGRLPYKEEYSEADYQFLLQTHRNGTVPWVMDGICMWMPIFRREILEEVGLYDERFYPGGWEDYDFNTRLYKKGYKCLGTAGAFVYHHWGKSKDDTERGLIETPTIDRSRVWNDLSSLYGGKHDIYGNCPDRTSEVATVDIR